MGLFGFYFGKYTGLLQHELISDKSEEDKDRERKRRKEKDY